MGKTKNKVIKKTNFVRKYLLISENLALADSKLLFETFLGKIKDIWIMVVPYDKTYIQFQNKFTDKEKKIVEDFAKTFFPNEYEFI